MQTVRPRRVTSEEGAVAVITALLLTVLLLFAAFVIDLGALRADRALGQSVADMAAAAGAQTYSSRQAGSAREACEDAIAYAEENLGVSLDPDGLGCNEFPDASGEICESSSWSPAVYTGGAYTVVVSIPVDNGDDLMQGVQHGTEIDGRPCQRLGVEVTRDRDYFLASAAGAGDGGSTTVGAVARAGGPGDLGQFASLIVLHRQRCEALDAAGSQAAEVRVEGDFHLVDGEEQYFPGIITVDSIDDGCGNPNQLIRADGQGELYASDHIFSYQLQQDPANAPNVVYSGNVDPTPESGRRITRAPVDHLYNCLSTYPAGERWSPNHTDSVSDGSPCEETGEIPPYLSELVGEYQDLDAAPTGWGVISGDDCSGLTGDFGPGAGDPETHWFVDCTGTSGQSGFAPDDVHFVDVEAVVTRGQVRMQDALRVTGADNTGAVFYVQAGRFYSQSDADLRLNETFVYLHDGYLHVGGQSSINWDAPLEASGNACVGFRNDFFNAEEATAAPPAVCFAPLALWTNSTDLHRLGGGGGTTTVGSFFTPNAGGGTNPNNYFSLHGGGGSDYKNSQFFAGRLRVRGGGTVNMTPNPDTMIELPLLGPSLIR